MKRSIVSVIATLLVLSGCVSPVIEPDLAGPLYTKEYWGEWVRTDAEETWYISGDAISINNAAASKSVSLVKQSERVIEVSEGERKYYLLASRLANTGFTGRIAGPKQDGDIRSARIALGGIAGAKIIVTNLKNAANKINATVEADGSFATREDIIPGDDYAVTAQGRTPVPVRSQGDGDDVGTITITDGVNFKAGMSSENAAGISGIFYANGVSHDFTIKVTNVGTADSLGATYRLGFETGLVSEAASTEGSLGSIGIGEAKTIRVPLKCGAIGGEYAFKKISVSITDTESGKTWEDSVSVKFYRAPVDFYLKTGSSAGATVSGVIVNTSDKKTFVFRKAGDNVSHVTVPWSSRDYLLFFSGATAGTRAAYALGVNRYPTYSDSELNGFTDNTQYEPNDTEAAAKKIPADNVMAYIGENDTDYYLYRAATPASVPDPIPDPGPDPGPGGDEPSAPLDLSLSAVLGRISAEAAEGGVYTVTLSEDAIIVPTTLAYGGKTVSITLTGDGTERKISLASDGSLFTVGSGVTLTLGSGVTLRGLSNNTRSLLCVEGGGKLEMEDGAKISGNTNNIALASYGGGGVFIEYGGVFNMTGGEISGNTAFATYGGGVYAAPGGTFTKGTGGVIYGSDASAALRNTAAGDNYGHAVYVSENQQRDTSAGAEVTLDSAKGGTAGGWRNKYTVTLQVALQPVADVPPLSSTSIFENQETQFSAGSGYESWVWYWDGEIIGGENTSAYTLGAHSKAPGIYELSVVVTTGTGALLSARCLVTIKTQ